MRIYSTVTLALVLGMPNALFCQAPKTMKVYISVDMEGIDGVAGGEQTGPAGFEYQQARKWMTAETNAAIEGAFETGATEVLVSDSHGNAQSILLDDLDKRALLVRGWPRKLIQMEGIDDTFAAVIFIGYHASEGHRDSVMPHTMLSARIFEIKLDGIQVPEAGFNAAIAGHFGVPVVLVSGDQTAIAETRKLIGDIEGAQVKTAHGSVAVMMNPQKAQHLILEKTKIALGRLHEFKPFIMKTPITMEITFKDQRDAEIAAFLPGVLAVDGRTIQYTGKDMVELCGLFAVISGLGRP